VAGPTAFFVVVCGFVYSHLHAVNIKCRVYKRTMRHTLNKINILKVDIEVVLLIICVCVLQ